ncbi:MAG: DNA recombination protein RmuC [Phycisphaerales bacterium]|nr:DNA recombination protein RmuC [Phycisphaerales bacterium]MCB9835306.1 DNA recombination protein RmuC [Phycisphaera sp.]
MDIVLIVLGVGVVALGGLAVWLGLRLGRVSGELSSLRAGEASQRQAADTQIAELRNELAQTRAMSDNSTQRVTQQAEELARLNERLENAELVRQELSKNENRLKEAFGALSAQALKEGRAEFLAQARPVFEAARKEQSDLVKPIGEVLSATREKLEAIEKSRAESFAALHERMELVTQAGRGLREETNKLTRALSRPEVRGQYGEIQLRRVAELAGMTSYCDFTEQTSVRDSEGSLLRPDMVVNLPNDRVIAVDAKTNTYAYIEAVNAADDAEREQHLERFARHVQEQAKKLADKKYWSQFDGSPEFVVMFVPGDHFIDAALSRKPELIDFAAQHGVILASPSTLIGLLRAVAVGWREERLAQEARGLWELGKELHERAAVAFEHAGKLGDSIRQSVERYNRLVGSIDSRLVPTLKKFEDAGAGSAKALTEVKQVEAQPKLLESGRAE